MILYKVNYNDHRVTQALKENICALFNTVLDIFILHFNLGFLVKCLHNGKLNSTSL